MIEGSKKKLSIVVPTYNEKDNIVPLITRTATALGSLDYEIVVVDDNSKDGTAAAAGSMSPQYPVRVIVRKDEKGLASAVVRGFAEAKGEILGVIDADLQHPPEVLPSMVRAIEEGADAAVGSRYVPGGGCQGWSRLRILESKVATRFAHIMLPSIRKVKDPMSGFFMVTRKSIAGIDLRPSGYKILLEILVKGKIGKTVEVPFVFQVRERGSSKLNTKQQVEYLGHVFALMRYSGELKRIAKYCIVGGSGVIVDMGIFWLLTSFAGLFNVIAAAASAETAIITNYTFNNFYTFADRSKPGVRSFFSRLLKFNLVSLSGIGIKLAVFWALTLIFGSYDLLFNLCGIAVATAWNYTVNTWWTWK
jgi:dolichol-phosphate mannosyltransferase